MEDNTEHDIYEDDEDESEENQYSDIPEYLSKYNLAMAVWLMMFILSHSYIVLFL